MNVIEDGSPIPQPLSEPATTDEQGRFVLRNVPPGAYLIGTRPSRLDHIDANVFAGLGLVQIAGYAESFWPGGVSQPRAALPIRLGPGTAVDAGTILLRKVRLIGLSVEIPAGDCPEGEPIRVTLMQPGSPEPVRFSVIRCGGSGLLPGIDPGSYLLYAVNDEQGERTGLDKAVWGSTPVTVTDEDESATLVMRRGVVIEGRLVPAAGVTLGKGRLNFASRPADLMPGSQPPLRAPMEQFVEWTGDDRFRMAVHPSPQEFTFERLAGFHIKQIRYNGVTVRNEIVPVTPGSGAHNLEVVLDDKATQIAGTVLDGTGNPAEAVVVLANPASGFVHSPYSEGMEVTETGQFAIPVTPGDYAIFAVPAAQREELEDPAVYKRLASAAPRLRIDPGVSQTVTLRIADAAR